MSCRNDISNSGNFIDNLLIPFFDLLLTNIKNNRIKKKESKIENKTEKRSHNCWNCKRTTDYNTDKGCFNKAYPPKESSEGLDCDKWI